MAWGFWNKLKNGFKKGFTWIKNKIIRPLIKKAPDIMAQVHTHTVCVPYYKAAPYNISHTKNFSMAIFTLIFFYKFFFMYVYHA